MTTAIIGHLPSLEWSPPTQGWSPMDPRLFDIATLGLHLGLSAKLKIWQVPTCKMEPRSGYIFCKNTYVAAGLRYVAAGLRYVAAGLKYVAAAATWESTQTDSPN